MLVVGAGVVGMACALALRRSGRTVWIADPLPPGMACSYGNAGIIATEHVLPLARPEVLRRLPAMLLDRHGPLYLKASRLPGLLPWFVRFALAARPRQVARGTRALAGLTGRALPAWRSLLGAAAAEVLCEAGMYTVYRSARAFDRDAAERSLTSDLGVASEILDGDTLRQREPALHPALTHAIYHPSVAHVFDPHAAVVRLAATFERAGGRLIDKLVSALRADGDGVIADTGIGPVRAAHVVIAAGLGARDLCRGLGIRMPLVAEMGYHVCVPGAQTRLTAPVADAEGGFIVTPMRGHLRAAGTVEFARREAPPAWHRADILGRRAAGLFREPLPAPAQRWRGSRPTLPDFLPAIGPLPGHPRVLAAFGHQHIGLTTAAVTASLIRSLVDGDTPALDVTPFDPGRFR